MTPKRTIVTIIYNSLLYVGIVHSTKRKYRSVIPTDKRVNGRGVLNCGDNVIISILTFSESIQIKVYLSMQLKRYLDPDTRYWFKIVFIVTDPRIKMYKNTIDAVYSRYLYLDTSHHCPFYKSTHNYRPNDRTVKPSKNFKQQFSLWPRILYTVTTDNVWIIEIQTIWKSVYVKQTLRYNIR